MTKEDLEQIRKRAEAATPGPWKCSPGDSWCAYPSVITPSRNFILEDHYGHDPGECERRCDFGYPANDEDAHFIAAARTDIPKLLDEVDRLREAMEEMIFAGREAYDNGYPEMEKAVARAREALESK